MKTNLGSNSVETTIGFAESGDQTFAYNADGTVNYIDAVVDGQVYRQTFTWSNGQLVKTSKWVKQ